MTYSYTPTVYVNDSTSVPVSAANLNRAENAIQALHSDKLDLAGGTMTGTLVGTRVDIGANRLHSSADTWLGSSTAHDVLFKSNNVERARFLSAGQLRLLSEIQRDDTSAWADRDSWLTFWRTFTNVKTGDDHSLIDLRFSNKQTGTVSDRAQGIKVIASDHFTTATTAITGATNATPIVITANSHGLSNGDQVTVYGVAGNTAANGIWVVASATTNTFALTGSTGNAAYVSGGFVTNRAMYYAGAFYVYPRVNRGGLTGAALNGDDVNCISLLNANGATAKATDCLYVGHASGATGSEWITIFTADCKADYGIRLNGAIDQYALDFSAGSQGQGAIRLGSTQKIRARNAANTADRDVITTDAQDRTVLEGPVRFNPRTSIPPLYDDFLSGGTGTGNIGSLGWVTNGSPTISHKTPTSTYANYPGELTVASAAVANQLGNLLLRPTTQVFSPMLMDILFIVRLATNDSDTKFRLGFTVDYTSDTPGSGLYVEKKFADTAFFALTRSASTESTRISLLTCDTNYHRIRMRRTASSAIFNIDDGADQTITTNLASASAWSPFLQITSQTTTPKSFDIDYFDMTISGLAR